jgi:DNA primase
VPVIVEGRLVDFVARLYVKSPPTIPKALSGRKVDGARKELAIWNFDRLDPELPMVYVTEGIWGALAMLRLGVRNVVAICGSAWSEERSELLGQWPTVVLVPDGDRAGEKLERVASKSLRRRSQVQVVRLPPGGQPDEIEPGELLRRLLDPDSPRCSEVLQCAPSDWAGKD